MNIEQQVCSLDLAKRLKEIGVKQDSLFYRFQMEGYQYIFCKYYEQYSPHVNLDINDGYSAFTISELLNLLPPVIDMNKNEPFNYFWLNIQKRISDNIRYIARYICDTISGEEISNPMFQVSCQFKSHSEKLTDCLAELLIQLIENGLIKP